MYMKIKPAGKRVRHCLTKIKVYPEELGYSIMIKSELPVYGERS